MRNGVNVWWFISRTQILPHFRMILDGIVIVCDVTMRCQAEITRCWGWPETPGISGGNHRPLNWATEDNNSVSQPWVMSGKLRADISQGLSLLFWHLLYIWEDYAPETREPVISRKLQIVLDGLFMDNQQSQPFASCFNNWSCSRVSKVDDFYLFWVLLVLIPS